MNLRSGDVTITGEISVNSDARLKKGIASIDDARALIIRLDGRTYHWKDRTGRDDNRHVGLIAQEVESVLPDLVSESAAGIKSVNYQGLVPVLINAVKEQDQTIQIKVRTIKSTHSVPRTTNLRTGWPASSPCRTQTEVQSEDPNEVDGSRGGWLAGFWSVRLCRRIGPALAHG